MRWILLSQCPLISLRASTLFGEYRERSRASGTRDEARERWTFVGRTLSFLCALNMDAVPDNSTLGNQGGIIGKVKSERMEINFVVPFSLQSFL